MGLTPVWPRQIIPLRIMVDWWQPLLYIGAGGVVSLVTAIVTNRLTTSANRESEERQAKRRVEEEQRQAKRSVEEEQRQEIRKIRRERVQPIWDLLEVAKRFVASRDSMRTFENMHAENLGGLRDQVTLDELQKAVRKRYPSPSIVDLANAFYVAMSTAAPREVDLALKHIIEGLQPSQSAEASANVKIAIGEAERTVEKYLVETESENGVSAGK